MSRQVHRVPPGFDWPLNKPWVGYVRPESHRRANCPAGDQCRTGVTPARARLNETLNLILMAADDVARRKRGRDLHPYLDGPPFSHIPRPSEDILELTRGLVGDSGMFGYDSLAEWRLTGKVIELAGLPEDWGYCPFCNGRGWVEAYAGQDADVDGWEKTDPPTGDAWQVWETVSEGSPVTPPFDTAEELARHLSAHPSALGGGSITYDAALTWVTGDGWIPSFVATDNAIISGANLAAHRHSTDEDS